MYTICTLAVGNKYFETAQKTSNDILKLSNKADCLIVTDQNQNIQSDNKKLIYYHINNIPTKTKDCKFFNYNLKFLPIKQAIQICNDYIIYIDGDWSVLSSYSDDKFIKLFNIMEEKNIDFIFERPHGIGHSKHQGRDCFWCHKVPYYDLLNTTRYDNADVCNEQCLVFRNNNKLKLFVDYWEVLFWRTYEENIWPFAEGLEIGMSTVEAEMKCSWEYLYCLNVLVFIVWMEVIMKDFNKNYITKYSNLIANDSLSSYKHHACQQNHNAYERFVFMLNDIRPKQILEIGTALGGFTAFLLDVIKDTNLECKIRSYDIHYNSWYEDLKNQGVDIRIENIFQNNWSSVPDEVVDYIKSDGVSLILCDGGSKKDEFRVLSKYLKINDIIMTHDYAPNREYFEEHMKNKIWNWHEIQDSDIIESCQLNGLEPFMKEEFLSVAWACFRKIS